MDDFQELSLEEKLAYLDRELTEVLGDEWRLRKSRRDPSIVASDPARTS